MSIAFTSQLKPSELVTYVIVVIIYWDTYSRLHTSTQLCGQQPCSRMPCDDPLSTHSTVVHWTTQVSRANQQQHRHTRWVVSHEMFSPSHVNHLDFVEESRDIKQTTNRSTMLTGPCTSKEYGKYNVVIDSLTCM